MIFIILRQAAFITVAFLLSYLLYLFPIFFYLGFFSISVSLVYQMIFSVFVGLLIILYLRTSLTFWPLKFFVYFGLSGGFYGGIISIICFLISPFISSQIIVFLMPVSLGLLLLYGYLNAQKVVIRRLEFSSKKILRPCRLIFISDVHLGSQSIFHLHYLIKKINELDPRALLIGGDLIDSSGFDLNQLHCLNELKMPIYFVTGNHEYYLNDSAKKINELSRYGVQNIDQKIIEDLGVRFIGIGDNLSKNRKLNWLKRIPKSSLFTILMVHQPSLWPEASDSSDLMLSGHTHAGQMAPFHWLVQLQFKFYKGLHQLNQSWLYVSSGAGNWGPRVRIGSNCELVAIQLLSE